MKNIYYLNLDENTERRFEMEAQFDKCGFTGKRIESIKGSLLKNEDYAKLISDTLGIDLKYLNEKWLKNRSNFKTMSNNIDFILPRFGLYLSTIKAIQTALKNGDEDCIILEDDAIITGKIEIPVLDCDLIYLGATFKGEKYCDGETILVDPKRIKLFGSFGYYIKNLKETLKVLLSVFQEGKSYDKPVPAEWRYSLYIKRRCQSIDLFYINYYQKYGIVYFLNPQPISHPNINTSTINKSQYKYSKNGLRFKY
tara:strand:- start:13 stop:774 length:762 start_codon:yes stop_codon:yes gene_type:complete